MNFKILNMINIILQNNNTVQIIKLRLILGVKKLNSKHK